MVDEEFRKAARRGRPFRAVDAVILIAAGGLGVLVSCTIEARYLEFLSWRVYGQPWSPPPQYDPGSWRGAARTASEGALLGVNLAAPVLAALSLAVVAIQALPPRVRRLRRARRPGTVAARAAVFALLYVMVFFTIKRFAKDPIVPRVEELRRVLDVVLAVNCLPVFAGLAIVSARTALLAARRWRAESGWLDRLGRTLAAAWIAAGLFEAGYYLAFRFMGTAASIVIFN